METKRIVFVCTGNICRSPMAEYLFRDRVGAAWLACSAGMLPMGGSPASTAAIHVMDEKGIDMRRHLSQELTRELAEDADLIVVMTASHRAQIAEQFRSESILDKVFLLKALGPNGRDEDVRDPIGASETFYRQIRDEIDAAMPGVVEHLKAEFGAETLQPEGSSQ